MIYLRFVFVLYLLSICISDVYCLGWGDWELETPYQNKIINYSGNGKVLKIKGNSIDSLQKWYFYKAHVVGKRQKGYFIAGETNGNIRLFDDELSWQTAIEEVGLKPWIITRWHKGGEDYLFMLTFWFVFGGFIIMIPLALAYIYAVYLAIRDRFRLSSPYMFVTLAMPQWIIIPLFLEHFPQSF